MEIKLQPFIRENERRENYKLLKTELQQASKWRMFLSIIKGSWGKYFKENDVQEQDSRILQLKQCL